MSNDFISIEKGRYQALLERVLGIQHGEYGITRGQVLANITRQTANQLESDISNEMSMGIETLGFIIDYFKLTEETLNENELYSNHEPKVVGKIDLRKSKYDDDEY